MSQEAAQELWDPSEHKLLPRESKEKRILSSAVAHHFVDYCSHYYWSGCFHWLAVWRLKPPKEATVFCLFVCFLKFTFLFVSFVLFSVCKACGILVPRPEIRPVPPAVEAQSPNYWTTREFLEAIVLIRHGKC